MKEEAERNPKVFIGVVTASAKDYCVNEFIHQLKSFNYDNYSIFVVDNSEDEKHTEIFKKEGIEVEHISRFKGNGKYKKGNALLCECQNRIRDKFLESDAEYLFMLESDCFINRDIIGWGISHDAPVYSVTYPVKVGRYNTPSMCLQYLHVMYGKKGIKSNTLMLPPSISLPAECKQITEFEIGDNMFLTQNGLGCVLIEKDVMKLIKFRVDRANDIQTGNMTFSDTFFYIDLLRNNVRTLLDNRLLVNHVKNW